MIKMSNLSMVRHWHGFVVQMQGYNHVGSVFFYNCFVSYDTRSIIILDQFIFFLRFIDLVCL